MQIYKLILLFFLTSSLSVNVLKAQELQENVTDSIMYGTIKIQFNVDSALVIINNQFDEARFINSGEIITSKTGRTSVKLSVIHDVLFEEIFVLKEDSLISIEHTFEDLPITKELLNGNYAARKYFNANLLVFTDNDTEISLNDDLVAKEFAFMNTPSGNNSLNLRSSTGSSSAFYSNAKQFYNSDYSLKVVNSYLKPNKKLSTKLAFLPGFSQSYKYEHTKSLLIRTGIVSSLVAVSTLELSFRNQRKDFNKDLEAYQTTTNSNIATSLGNELNEKKEKLDRTAILRNISLGTLISIYAYNILDGILTAPGMGYREEKPIQFYLDSNQFSSLDATLKVSLN